VESRRAVCVEKWPEAQAERVAGVHVFSSEERAETTPAAGWECKLAAPRDLARAAVKAERMA
jgi:hypothetical protein